MIIEWKTDKTVAGLPPGLWDEMIGRGEVCLDSRLILTAEQIGDSPRRYFTGLVDGRPVALFMGTEESFDPFMDGGESVRTVVTGTPETTGWHVRFDETIPFGELLSEAETAIGQSFPKARAIMFRDFTEREKKRNEEPFLRAGYTPVRVMDVSRLVIPDHIRSLTDYPGILKAKHRYQWNRYRSAIAGERYAVESVTNFVPLLNELYPLYLEVASRAEEYEAEPYPPEYFRRIRENFGDDAVMVTIRDTEEKKYIGFMLLLYGEDSCVHQYIGFNLREDLFLWHNLTIESIGDAIHRGVSNINMGVTHSLAKHKFGASNDPTYVFVKKFV